MLVYADRSKDMQHAWHTHRNKVQGHHVQPCLTNCGTLGNVSHPCKHSKHILGCTHAICTAASTHFFTHTSWHGLACTWAIGITPALAFSTLSASVLSFLPHGGVSTYLIRLENCLLILTRKARKRPLSFKGRKRSPNQ